MDSVDCNECSGDFTSECLCVAPTYRCPSVSWLQVSVYAVYSDTNWTIATQQMRKVWFVDIAVRVGQTQS